jgi:uncharacterized membrane protein YiaA
VYASTNHESKAMKSIIAFLVGVLISLAMHWLGGFDFNERGFLAVRCAILSLLIGIISLAAWRIDNGGKK